MMKFQFNRLSPITNLLLIVFLIILGSCAEKETYNQSSDMVSEPLFNKYDPNQEFPLGQLNPEAPAETGQFSFMVGEFVCDDSLLVNGTWVYSKATWNSEYILNGYGIKDTYRNHNYAGTSIRVFNTTKQKWDVYFFGMPGIHSGLWEGAYEDGNMVMRQKRTGPNGEPMESRLTFYEITENSFEWKGESVNLETGSASPNWKISARKGN